LKQLTVGEMQKYTGPGFIVAKDYAKIIDFIPSNGAEAKEICHFLRFNASKLLLGPDGNYIENPDFLDEGCHKVPLFIVKDQKNLITDKQDLVEVINLKFRKGDNILQSLMSQNQLRRVLTGLATFDCEFELQKEIRYVSPEFANYMD
jgi:hypothetical protein